MRAGAAAAAALAAALGTSAAAGFVDPLDLPAERSPLAARGPFAGIAAAGGRLVAVGERGHVVLSDDGGATWTQAAVPVSADLTAVRFVSSERGWAVGHDGVVLATRDGGRSWTAQLDGRRLAALLGEAYGGGAPPGSAGVREQLEILAAQGAGLSLLDVHFADERTGFAVGAFNLVVRTDDGGETWTPWLHRTENPRGLHLYAIGRAAGELWVVGEQGLVLKLDAAGRRFEAVRAPWSGTLFGVAGAGPAVVVCGLRGSAFLSRDGGARWERLDTGVDATLTAAAALPGGALVLATQAGHLLVSADGGGSFRAAPRGLALPISALAAAGAHAVALAGPAGARVEPLGAGR